MANKISTTQERLAEMMKEFGISAVDIVRKTGINKSTLSNYINGKRVADQKHLSIIADPYGIDPAWLMGYNVPMKTAPSITVDLSNPSHQEAFALYSEYESLPPEKREEFLNFLKFLQSNS